jgi:hypothetical protein
MTCIINSSLDPGSQGSMSQSKTPEKGLSVAHFVESLPIISQARIMFEHFASTLHLVLGVLHIPSTRNLLEETYRSIQQENGPGPANILLLYGIFAGAVLAWTPGLLGSLKLTKADAKIAFKKYTEMALSIINNPHQTMSPSLIALEGIINLTHVLNNTAGLSAKVTALRHLCQSMARSMQIHRLDTSKSVKERQQKPYDAIEVEVMRRIWWDMVASDWYDACKSPTLPLYLDEDD